MNAARDVFVTGATGYIGSRLIPALLERGHRVRAFVRPGSEARVPPGASPVVGDALDPEAIAPALRPGDTVVQLVGTPHPSPRKAREFVRVDLASVRASVAAAARAGAAHFIYVSVAQPAPVMAAYIAARAQGEQAIAAARLTASVLRPLYVLGPGHLWPLMLVPVYCVAQSIPRLRAAAQRLGLVTIGQMLDTITHAVENPPGTGDIRIIDVPAIRAS